jgi:hypothetical protein
MYVPCANITDLGVQLVQSILDQSHLTPLTSHIQPVLPDFDHTLRLYPLPTAVSSCLVTRAPKHKVLLGDFGRQV